MSVCRHELGGSTPNPRQFQPCLVNYLSVMFVVVGRCDRWLCLQDGLTPLHCTARSGHEAAVDLLLERGAQVLAKTKNGLGPLHMAVQGDHVSCCRLLLYHKAPIDDVTVVSACLLT